MRRSGEHGGITPLMVGLIMVLLTILVGASAVGRLAMIRADAQRGADSACLLAANVIRQQGLPFSAQKKRAVADIALRNLGAGASIEILSTDEPDRVTLACNVSQNVGVPWGAELVRAHAGGSAPQTKYDQTKRIIPRTVLVLDYSGSMEIPMNGDPGGRKSAEVLRDAIRRMLEKNLQLELGAVLFSDDTDKVDIAKGNEAAIAAKLGRREGGSTNTAAALDRANDLLSAHAKSDPDQASFVVLASDGRPNDVGAAKEAARRLRDGEHLAEIFTLHIENQTTDGEIETLRDFMVSISGNNLTTTLEDRLQRYFTARTTAELNRMIDALSGLLACPVKLAALPPPGERMYTFLRSPSGDEVPMRDIREIDPTAERKHLNDEDDYNYFNQNVFWLEVSNTTMYVSKLVCNKMLEADHVVVVRTGRPRLTE